MHGKLYRHTVWFWTPKRGETLWQYIKRTF